MTEPTDQNINNRATEGREMPTDDFLEKLRTLNAMHAGKSVADLPPYEFSLVRITFPGGTLEGDAYMLTDVDGVESLTIGTRPFAMQHHHLGGEMQIVRGTIPTKDITKIEVVSDIEKKKGW